MNIHSEVEFTYKNIADHLQSEINKLIDHITSGAEDQFFVYGPTSSEGPFSNYADALRAFDAIIESGRSYIALATRVGTAVVMLVKTIQ